MVNVEEKLLVNVLYKEERESLQGIDISNVNFENLIKLASRHLMLPALFFNINKKNLSHLFPEDFIECIKNIYSINKARNKILLKEAKELSEILYKNNINHIFLKGTALLLSNVFEDIGERMIGDIDFIIQHKDEEKIKKVLEKNNYCNKYTVSLFRIFKPTHLPKQVHKNKTIALEPHLELLEPKNRWIFNSKELINDFKNKTKTIKTPSKIFLIDHCILGAQIRNSGFINSSYDHRSIYDVYKLNCEKSLIFKKNKKDIFIKHFFLTIHKFKIFDFNIVSSLSMSFTDQLSSFISIRLFNYSIIIENYLNKFSVIINLFFNNILREKALNKIIENHKNKTLLKYMYTWLKS
ncbi:nucleotidyltransferase family protein [Flavobacteriaceae bacterium]|nr:nucleotidyltransferase family protein [Flavobacteriaceae bacterium]